MIKGPQTALHGPGNSAATVLFERDRPRFDEAGYSLHASALIAAAGRRDLVADATFGTERLFARLSGTRAEADDYEDGAERRVHSEYSRLSADATLGWTPDENTLVALSGTRSDGEAAYADRRMDGAMFRRENLGLRFERDRRGSALRRIEAQVFYNYIDHAMDNYSLRSFTPSMMMPNPSASNPDRRTTGARIAVELGAQTDPTVSLGVDTQQNVHRVRSTMNQALAPYQSNPRTEDARFNQFGVFGETSWPLAQNERVIGGARIDYWEAQDSRKTLALSSGMMTPPNPTAGAQRSETLAGGFVRWERDLQAPATLYVGVGRVERFPDYWEALGEKESVDSLSAFHVKPEQTTQLDAGLMYRSARLELSVSGFYGRIDDYLLIQSNYMKGMRSSTVTRNVDATTLGAEVDAAYPLGAGWKATGALAYSRGRNRTDDLPLAQTPPLELRAGLGYDAASWSVGLLVRTVADQERYALNQGNVIGQDLGRTDGFTTLSASASWHPRANLLVSAGADNLLDRAYAEHLSRSGAMLTGYEQTERVYEPGRTMWLRVGAEF